MKASMYNWLVEHEGDTIAYNGLTGAMAVLEEENISSLGKVILSSGNVDNLLEELDESLVEALKHGGYIINDSSDERTLLRISYNKKIYFNTREHSGFTLVMTKKCNFRCIYCYEHKTLFESGSITQEALDKVVETAEKSASKHFSLSLYGGEPLLEYEKCIDVCRQCKKVVEARNGVFFGSMVTNGFLLTPERAESLKDCGVGKLQVTIDGSRETHNTNRPHMNGTGTYDVIMKNVENCAGIIPISIRMNTSDPNTPEIEELQTKIAPMKDVSMYVAPVDLSCRGDLGEYLKNRKQIAETLPPEVTTLNTINARTGGCAANGMVPAVVLPNGNLVRCWEHMDDCDSSSSLLEPDKPEDIDHMAKWVGWNPYIPGTRCYECRYLPNCGGGCPKETIDYNSYKCLYISDEHYIKSIIGSVAKVKESNEKGHSLSPAKGEDAQSQTSITS